MDVDLFVFTFDLIFEINRRTIGPPPGFDAGDRTNEPLGHLLDLLPGILGHNLMAIVLMACLLLSQNRYAL